MGVRTQRLELGLEVPNNHRLDDCIKIKTKWTRYVALILLIATPQLITAYDEQRLTLWFLHLVRTKQNR